MSALRLISSFQESIEWFIEDHPFFLAVVWFGSSPTFFPLIRQWARPVTHRRTDRRQPADRGGGGGRSQIILAGFFPLVSHLSCQLIAMKPELVGTLLHCVIESLVVEATLLWARYNRYQNNILKNCRLVMCALCWSDQLETDHLATHQPELKKIYLL